MENLDNIQNNPDCAAGSAANATTETTSQNLLSSPSSPPEPPTPVVHAIDGDTFKAIIADAERRGYDKGREETLKSIEASESGSFNPEPVPTFLSHLRPDFWD